jgi:hypothetical protein
VRSALGRKSLARHNASKVSCGQSSAGLTDLRPSFQLLAARAAGRQLHRTVITPHALTWCLEPHDLSQVAFVWRDATPCSLPAAERRARVPEALDSFRICDAPRNVVTSEAAA